MNSRTIQRTPPPPEPLNASQSAHVELNIKQNILLLLLSFGLLVGCASEFQSAGSSSSATDNSADRSFHDMIDRMNEQTARDAANAAAHQQNNAAMAAAQEMENQHNDEFNRNALH